MGEPILGKMPPEPHWDYKLRMTWPLFRKLRGWAQDVANKEQAQVYLVGSVLYKSRPRDLDVSIVLPEAEFVRRFGPIPDSGTEAMQEYLRQLHLYIELAPRHYYTEGSAVIGHRTRFDLKICPDSWWRDKPRLLLAEPREG